MFLKSTGKILASIALLATVMLTAGGAAADNLPFFSSFPNIDQHRWSIDNGWTNGPHQACEWRADAFSGSEGRLHMTLSDKGGKVLPYGCPEIQTIHMAGYGLYQARMRTAAGLGLNTAFFTYTGPPFGPQHDEIDFEFLGKDPHSVQINWWVSGKTHPVMIQLGFDASKEFHNYSFDWTPTKIRYYVDKKMVYETPDGAEMPSHPSKLFFSLWAGTKMEDSWLGHFDYSEPVTADIEWAKYTPEQTPGSNGVKTP